MSALTLADAKAHLNISGTPVNLGDTEFQSLIDSAESLIAERTGPLVPTTVTDRVWSNGYQITLRTTPVISLTSVTSVYANQTALPASLFISPAGVITWADGRSVFFAGYYDVVYQAGYASVPAGLLYAVKEMVRHLVMTQRGAGRAAQPSDQMAPGYLFPYRVSEAMEPYVQEFGFA